MPLTAVLLPSSCIFTPWVPRRKQLRAIWTSTNQPCLLNYYYCPQLIFAVCVLVRKIKYTYTYIYLSNRNISFTTLTISIQSEVFTVVSIQQEPVSNQTYRSSLHPIETFLITICVQSDVSEQSSSNKNISQNNPSPIIL